MIVLVCGGRNFDDAAALSAALNSLDISLLIEGGARGADRLAREWAGANMVPVRTFAADWRLHGGAAGPIRNAAMLRGGKPDLIVAFPGGRGTADMCAKAELAGVRVIRPLG